MAGPRIEFHEFLIRKLKEHGSVAKTSTGWVWTPVISKIGTDDGLPIYVYHQPPENLQLHYPCLIYELDDIRKTPADNMSYLKFRRYKMTYITWGPDSSLIDWLVDLPYCSMSGAPYEADNLYHYPYKIYY